jgi:hypothetical protein
MVVREAPSSPALSIRRDTSVPDASVSDRSIDGVSSGVSPRLRSTSARRYTGPSSMRVRPLESTLI